MQLISCHNGQLLTIDARNVASGTPFTPGKVNLFSTGLAAIDDLLPGRGLARGAVHELLWKHRPSNQTEFKPFFFTACIARAAIEAKKLPIVWCDPRDELYPPALGSLGIPLEQLFVLKSKTPQDELWAIAQCLACKAIGATIAAPQRLTRIHARRLQLAAERGGGVGLILRPHDPRITGKEHAAATRWLVEPAPGERTIQRWKIQLIHGHGGLTHKPVYLEYHRDRDQADRLRATDQLADRPDQAPAAKTKRA